jgi:hypothetical protein
LFNGLLVRVVAQVAAAETAATASAMAMLVCQAPALAARLALQVDPMPVPGGTAALAAMAVRGERLA